MTDVGVACHRGHGRAGRLPTGTHQGRQPAQPGDSRRRPAPRVAPTSRRTPAQPASGPSPTTATATRRTDFGFIRSWYAKTGTFYLRFDRAVLLTGAAADAASAAHGGESPVPNDYYIQNDNPRLRDVVIVDRATVIGSQQLTGSPGPNPSSLRALLAFVAKGGPQLAATPFHLTYNDHGLVVRVQEQYRPQGPKRNPTNKDQGRRPSCTPDIASDCLLDWSCCWQARACSPAGPSRRSHLRDGLERGG